jgi:glutathione S-transferase
MEKPKLIYFDAAVSRGEECRLALHLAGIDFDDLRVKQADWPAMKESMPYGALPVLELPGCASLAQSNAILVLIGRRYGLHPADECEAARHEGMMQHVEDLRAAVAPTIRMADSEKKAAREALVAGFLPAWAKWAERNIGTELFFGARHQRRRPQAHGVRWFLGGKVDFIPAAIFGAYPSSWAHDGCAPSQMSWYAVVKSKSAGASGASATGFVAAGPRFRYRRGGGFAWRGRRYRRPSAPA